MNITQLLSVWSIVFSLIPLISSCSNDVDDLITIDDSSITHYVEESNIVSEAEAFNVADNFNTKRFGYASNRSSKKIETLFSSDGSPVAYVVNNSECGWVIVSTTKTYHPILAYSDDISNEFNTYDGMSHTGLSIWIEEIANAIRASEGYDEATKTQINAEWNSILGNNLAAEPPVGNTPEAIKCRTRLKELNDTYYLDGWTFSTLNKVTDGPNLPNEVYDIANNVGSPFEFTIIGIKDVSHRSEVEPLLKTTWDQSYTTYSGNAGCIPIAMGQIMRYHRFPNDFNWDAMGNSSADNANIALIDHIRATLGMTDNGSDTGAAVKGFKKYGYSAEKKSHSNNDVMVQISLKQPVYMHGRRNITTGHSWVCDGYVKKIAEYQYYVEYLNSVTEYTNYGITLMENPGSCGGQSYGFLHMNWGWGGKHDGMYTSPTPGDKDYSLNRENVYVSPN